MRKKLLRRSTGQTAHGPWYSPTACPSSSLSPPGSITTQGTGSRLNLRTLVDCTNALTAVRPAWQTWPSSSDVEKELIQQPARNPPPPQEKISSKGPVQATLK